MKIVFASRSAVVAHAGLRIHIRAGEPWDGDDPLVRAYPGLFTAGPAVVRTTRDPSGVVDVPVQEAGERPVQEAGERPARPGGARRTPRGGKTGGTR